MDTQYMFILICPKMFNFGFIWLKIISQIKLWNLPKPIFLQSSPIRNLQFFFLKKSLFLDALSLTGTQRDIRSLQNCLLNSYSYPWKYKGKFVHPFWFFFQKKIIFPPVQRKKNLNYIPNFRWGDYFLRKYTLPVYLPRYLNAILSNSLVPEFL